MKGCGACCLSRSTPTPTPQREDLLSAGASCMVGTNPSSLKRPNMGTAFGGLEFLSMTLLSLPREENPKHSPQSNLSVVFWPVSVFSKS